MKKTMAERILSRIGSGPHDTKAEVLSEVLEIADACEDMLSDRRGREIVRISRTRYPVARDLWRRICKARDLAAAGNYDAVPEYIPGLPW